MKFYCLIYHSCGLERVIIACGHLTNMQGCHGNCSGCMCVQITIGEGTGIKQIQTKGGLLSEVILTGC